MKSISRHPHISRAGRRSAGLISTCFAWAVVIIGCGHPNGGAAQETEDAGTHKKIDGGPVTVETHLDRRTMTIAERLNFTIDVTADEAYEIELPGFGEKLEQFGIVDYQTIQPELVADNRVHTGRTYILEPFLSGEYKIPPMELRFWERDAGEDAAHTVETEELTVQVTSLLPETFEDLTIHDIAKPVALPRNMRAVLWIAAICAALLAGGIAGFVIWRKTRRPLTAEEIRIRAHERAFGDLEELIAEDLVGKGELKEFYQRISGILRRYIEDRFGLRAPEQTTEEFLATLGSTDVLDPSYRDLLKDFLSHCDLVKFAELQPTKEDIQNTFDSCKRFILETQENGSHQEQTTRS